MTFFPAPVSDDVFNALVDGANTGQALSVLAPFARNDYRVLTVGKARRLARFVRQADKVRVSERGIDMSKKTSEPPAQEREARLLAELQEEEAKKARMLEAEEIRRRKEREEIHRHSQAELEAGRERKLEHQRRAVALAKKIRDLMDTAAADGVGLHGAIPIEEILAFEEEVLSNMIEPPEEETASVDMGLLESAAGVALLEDVAVTE